MHSRLQWLPVLAAVIAALLACSKREEAPPAAQPGPRTGVEQKEIQQAARETTMERGKAVYETNCASCHATGLAGAPVVGDKAAWSEHIAHGIEHMVQNVVNGIGAMPPKGGNPALSEEEIRAAVHYMVEQSH